MPHTLLASYPRTPDRFDEMIGGDGDLRPGWSSFFEHIGRAAPGLARTHLDIVRRAIRENGVTYNVYADPAGTDRPWELDPLPLIITATEWAEIAGAVTQRARLLNAILVDLYGEQSLLRDHSLPPALVYGHQGFLWPCHGMRPPGDTWLHLYAADLARSPDGRWWVIGDRAQAPSGAGYALENRLIVSRLFTDPIRDLDVRHLGSFFTALQASLRHWAPDDGSGSAPLVVLLTPGPYNETYFEHAYLARQLGYPLVEGQDLTVRDDRVYLRTLTGLVRVHVILRRLDDDYCDPLELRGESTLGTPGLVQAVRAGNVLVANALGTGLLQSAALPGFLPGICNRLLGESLQMPTVGTWWCGEPAALDFVLAHLDQLGVKGAFPSQRMDPVFGGDLTPGTRAALIERLRARPYAYVAQEIVRFSVAPSWNDAHVRRLAPRGVALRVFAVATPDGYRVMPGGLTRVTSATDARFISLQRGGSSKDAWVLGGRSSGNAAAAVHPPATAATATATTGATERMSGRSTGLVRSGTNLTSRVVENLFWFGRYSERCEDSARLLRASLARIVDAGPADLPLLAQASAIGQVLEVLPKADDTTADPSDHPMASLGEIEARMRAGLVGNSEVDGLAGTIRRLLWTGLQVRERLSVDNWRALNQLHYELAALRPVEPGESSVDDLLSFLDRSLLATMGLAGFAMDDMTRDDGWRFLVIGRRLERLQFTALAVADVLRRDAAATPGCLEWLLELADSIITYRSRYMAVPELGPVVDLIVCDDANPRAVIFQAHSLLGYLGRLPREASDPSHADLRAACTALSRFDPAGLRVPGDSRFSLGAARLDLAARTNLTARLDEIIREAAALSDRLAMRYFTHIADVGRPTLAA